MDSIIDSSREPEYLGDGLYAEFDGYHIRLFASHGDRIHHVFLEPETLAAFLRYVEKLKGATLAKG
jgi:hypothetical protein